MIRRVIVVLCVGFVCGCETLEFYRQAAVGEVSILSRRESTHRLLFAPDTDSVLRARLIVVSDILQFARDRLSLDPGRQFSSYVVLQKPYVVWNIFATEELSMHPTQWCYPIVGCATYRGYFDAGDARRMAQRLKAQQHDVAVGGVVAFSTLGWFDDPLLSTYLNWPDPDLAALIFHELAHGRVFVKGDASFNEAFATFVERQAVQEWLAARGERTEMAQVRLQWQKRDQLVRFMMQWRAKLQALYDQPYDRVAQRMLKADMMDELERCMREHADRFDVNAVDRILTQPMNNARFATFSTYFERADGFAGLFVESARSWPDFFAQVKALGRTDAKLRDARLQQLSDRYRGSTEPELVEPAVRCRTLAFGDVK